MAWEEIRERKGLRTDDRCSRRLVRGVRIGPEDDLRAVSAASTARRAEQTGVLGVMYEVFAAVVVVDVEMLGAMLRRSTAFLFRGWIPVFRNADLIVSGVNALWCASENTLKKSSFFKVPPLSFSQIMHASAQHFFIAPKHATSRP